MKKILPCLILCVIFTSCKKNNTNNVKPSGKLYNVTFHLSNFSQQHTGFTTNSIKKTDLATSGIVEPFDTLTTYYAPFFILQSGNTQHTEPAHYDLNTLLPYSDTLKMQLAAGNYTMYFAVGENDEYFSTTYPELNGPTWYMTYDNISVFSYLYYPGAYGYIYTHINDLFFDKVNFTVSNSDINQDISLNRVDARLDVIIKDAIPTGIKDVTLQIDSFATQYDINNGVVPDTVTAIQPFYNLPVGTTNIDLQTLTFNTSKPFTVTIRAYTSYGILATKTISNVTCAPNEETVLTGYLFGGSGGSGNGISIGADTAWSATTLKYSF